MQARVYAEDASATVVSGYITAVHPPDEFEVKGVHVTIAAATRFSWLGGSVKDPETIRRGINVGAYVQATGTKNWKTNTVAATAVAVRDDTGQTVSGAGVIDRVIASGAESVFRADGYMVRINKGTEVRSGGGFLSPGEAGTNTWMRFEGRRTDSGEVLAAKVSFAKPKLPRQKHDPMAVQVTTFPPGSMIDFDGAFRTERAKHRMEDAGGWCGWYPVPQNAALQEGVRRIGMSLVPQYQRDLPEDDPGKIPFRFYAVDEKSVRSEIFCDKGLVLVPVQVIRRLKNDDQLAALLADGVAAELRSQQAHMMLDMGLISVAEAAAFVAVRSAAGVGAVWVGGAIAGHEIARKMEDERGRMALGLMSDAGFDPWQAPEVWRLLAPSHLPKDLAKLKYPARSTYLLSVLDLQYKRAMNLNTPTAEERSTSSR
jgi:hypothetical protein